MTESAPIPDAVQRQRALDISRSLIVQAPAGSGKTELLIQRLLALLGIVDTPEEVVAITFTRKAAGEMRQRVIDTLMAALSPDDEVASHRRHAVALARAVLQKDARLGWSLLSNPGRLRIQTIDAFCASLCRQMPVVTGFGAQRAVTEDVASLYTEATRRTLGLLFDSAPWSDTAAKVLSHLDNDFAAAERLLVGMLRRRDQWLRHVGPGAAKALERATLESAIGHWIEIALHKVSVRFPDQYAEELLHLARFAASNMADDKTLIYLLSDLQGIPDASAEALPLWQGIADLLVTKNGSVRKQVNVSIGFPPAKGKENAASLDEHKARMVALLSLVGAHEEFIESLHAVRALPNAAYSDVQWEALEALIGLLPLLVAQWNLVCNERGVTDFSEVAMAAVRALGADEAPSDLALGLDYRVRHILLDEFQDTTPVQIDLLKGLTQGWEAGDGRTLFLVGDPMQSIYRFRQAEVGLFLRARQVGIGQVPLEALTLTTNFRSQSNLVEWFNDSFTKIFPVAEDANTEAVPYTASQAVRLSTVTPAVCVYPSTQRDDAVEARSVCEIIRAALARNPASRIAVLVTSRGHLAAILPALREHAIAYQAIEIERLREHQVVQDLLALTRALLHYADRVAWLALLRAPWCGLDLADLEVIARLATQEKGRSVAEVLWGECAFDALSEEGRARVRRFADRLARFVENRSRLSLRRWIEGAWLAIGGPAACATQQDLRDATTYMDLLDSFDLNTNGIDLAHLARKAESLYARDDVPAEGAVQVMTIHKAKGLEFDEVILPGLGVKNGRDEAQLLRWLALQGDDGVPRLLLAPIGVDRDSAEPLHAMLKGIEVVRASNEQARLLYVAATRARERLHLLGHVGLDAQGQPYANPMAGSMLARLWPVVHRHFENIQVSQAMPMADEIVPHATRRFALHWEPPQPEPGLGEEMLRRVVAYEGEIEFSWASEVARKVGVLVHQVLQQMADEGIEAWSVARVDTLGQVIERRLRAMGVPGDRLNGACANVGAALRAVLADERGRWALSTHAEAKSELRLTGVLDGQLQSVAMDRTFVDEEAVRWIIDYKTSPHDGADVDGFLDNERERYRSQLERYAAMFKALGETRSMRLALYFPLQQGWREWAAQG